MLYMPPTAKAAPPAARIPAIIFASIAKPPLSESIPLRRSCRIFFSNTPILHHFSENASKLCCRFCSDFVNKIRIFCVLVEF